jgi:tyrosyl-tRNA synthetase
VEYSRFQVYNSSVEVLPTYRISQPHKDSLKLKMNKILARSIYKDKAAITKEEFLAFSNCIYKGISSELIPFQEMLAKFTGQSLLKDKATDLLLDDLLEKIESEVKRTTQEKTPSQ